jgi:hypothetical protein
MSDVERIAKGLTEAQKRAVIWLPNDGEWKVRKTGDISETPLWSIQSKTWGNLGHELVTVANLAKHRNSAFKEKGRVWPAREWSLTPLGQAVRYYLKGNQ